MDILLQKSFSYAEVTIFRNGIFHTHYTGTTNVSYEMVKEITEWRWENMNNNPCLSLSSSVNKFSIPEKKAFQFLHSQKRINTVIAHAYIIKSIPQQLQIKVIELLVKLPIPTKGFKKEKDAINWLLSMKNKKQ